MKCSQSSREAAPSAGADAVDGDDGRVHQAQLLVLVDAQLVAAAAPALERRHLGVGLGARRQQEAHAAGDQHVPNAVDVEVVLLRLHEGVQGHGRRGDHGAREEEERPALPGGRVAAAPADGAHRLAGPRQTPSQSFFTPISFFFPCDKAHGIKGPVWKI